MNKKKMDKMMFVYLGISLIIVILFLTLPIIYVDTDQSFYANGFRILAGTYRKVPSESNPKVIETITILKTSSFNFCAILFPIGSFLFYKTVSNKPMKRLSAFLCAVVGFIYILFIPIMANSWRNLMYLKMDISRAWGWIVVSLIYLAYLIFIIIDLIITLKKEKKELPVQG